MRRRATGSPAVRATAATVLVVTLLVGLGQCGDERRAADRGAQPPAVPRVLILALDTVRADHLPPHRPDWIRTSAVDALARDGVTFARCLSTSPWTGPAFASLYTGLLPYHHGFISREFGGIGAEQTTMAELLSARGLDTAAFVSVAYLTHAFGMHQGYTGGRKFTVEGGDKKSGEVSDGGMAFLRDHRQRPFFLFLHYFEAHAPYLAPPPFGGMYYQGNPRAAGPILREVLARPEQNVIWDKAEIYAWLEDVTDYEWVVKQYAAGVTAADHQVGTVLDELKRLGLYDDTLIILVADHGEHLGEHGIHFAHTLPYQETLQVPLIIKWPGNRHAGAVVGEWVSIVDVLPTLLEILGYDVPAGLDGISLVGGPGGPPGPGERASPLIAEEGASVRSYHKALLDDPWKMLLFGREEGLGAQLFHLREDPGELRDLAAERPDVVERLTARLEGVFDWRRPLTTVEALPEGRPSEEVRRRLRALGYVD